MLRDKIQTANPKTSDELLQKIKEIFQEFVLHGLFKGGFFDKGIFYGGTALRILHGLDRFSEDLDFTLEEPNENFFWVDYRKHIVKIFESCGIHENSIFFGDERGNNIKTTWLKIPYSAINVAINDPEFLLNPPNKFARVRIEIDPNPSGFYSTEVKQLNVPPTIPIKTYTRENLFAGKLHAVLCRKWGRIAPGRNKGRDLWDFLWFLERNIPVNVIYLKEKMVQTGDFQKNKQLNEQIIKNLLEDKFNEINFEHSKADIKPFISDIKVLESWNAEYFNTFLEKLKISDK